MIANVQKCRGQMNGWKTYFAEARIFWAGKTCFKWQ